MPLNFEQCIFNKGVVTDLTQGGVPLSCMRMGQYYNVNLYLRWENERDVGKKSLLTKHGCFAEKLTCKKFFEAKLRIRNIDTMQEQKLKFSPK